MCVFVDELTIGDDLSDRVSLLLDIVEAVYIVSDAYVYGYGLDTEHVGSIGENWGPVDILLRVNAEESRAVGVSGLQSNRRTPSPFGDG